MRSELGKLMRIARIARPDAIYDASAAARNFASNKPKNYDGEIYVGEMKEKRLMGIFPSRLTSNMFRDIKVLWEINWEVRTK